MGKVNWGDHEASMKARDAIRNIVRNVLDQLRPLPTAATVVSVDRASLKATVIKETDTEPVTIGFLSDDGPWNTGDIVLVENNLGIQRITKVIYSAAQPGGTYIRPALVNPALAGLTSVFRQNYCSESQALTVGQAWYFGRWIADGSVKVAYIEVLIAQQAPTQALKRYRVYLNTWASGWDSPTTVESHVLSSADYDIDLQVRQDVDTLTGFNTVELQVVQTHAIGAVAGITLDATIYGKWTQDLSATEGISA